MTVAGHSVDAYIAYEGQSLGGGLGSFAYGGGYRADSTVVTISHTSVGAFIDGPVYFIVEGAQGSFIRGHDRYHNSRVVLEDNPVAYYELDESIGSTQILDSSGNNNHSTAYGGGVDFEQSPLTTNPEPNDKGAFFNGDYFNVPRSIGGGDGSFSIEFWIKTTIAGGGAGGHWWQGVGIVDGEVSGVSNDFGTSLGGGAIQFGVGNGDVTIRSAAINDNKRHHVVCTRNGTTGAMRIYVDSTLVASGTGAVGAKTSPSALRIGGLLTGANGTLTNTYLDDIALYNYVLTQEQVKKHFNALDLIFTEGYVHGIDVAQTSVGSYIYGDTEGTVTLMQWAFIPNLGVIRPEDNRARGRCFIYGQRGGGGGCNDFSNDPEIQVTSPPPQGQRPSWDGSKVNFQWFREDSVNITTAAHYWAGPAYNGDSPYFEMDWRITSSDYETYASTNMFRYASLSSAQTAGRGAPAGKPHIQLHYTWDSDHGVGRAIKADFWNGTTYYSTQWVGIAVGITYRIKVFIDSATNQGVLQVNDVQYRVNVGTVANFQGSYDTFVLPQGASTAGGSIESRAYGWIDNLCVPNASYMTGVSSTDAFIMGEPLIHSYQEVWLARFYVELGSQEAFIQGNPEVYTAPRAVFNQEALLDDHVNYTTPSKYVGELEPDDDLISQVTPSGFVGQLEDTALQGYTNDGLSQSYSDPIIDGIPGRIPAKAIRAKTKQLGVFMYGNAEGVTGILSGQMAFIWIGEPGNAYLHAYIRTPEPIQSVRPAFTFGHKVHTDSQSAFIMSTHDITEGTNAYIAGIAKERFSTWAFIQIATPLPVSTQHAYIHSATPLEEAQNAYLKGHLSERSGVDTFVWGLQFLTGLKRSYVHIETPMFTLRRAYVNGPPAETVKPAFIFGMYVARIAKPAFIQIETPRTVSKAAFIRGSKPERVVKRAYLDGHWAISSSKPAFIQIITPRLETKRAYISGPLQITSLKRSYIDGINQDRLSKPAYMYGHFVTPPSAVGAYVHIEEFVFKKQMAYIKVGEPVFAPKPSFVRGLETLAPFPQHCYMDSRIKVTLTQPAFIQIQNPMNAPVKRAFVQIQTLMNAPIKRAYIRNVGQMVQPHLAYTNGAYKETKVKSCYIHSETPIQAPPQRCFIRNQPDISSAVYCYIFETGLNLIIKHAYVNGTRMGEVDVTKKCYIDSHDIRVFAEYYFEAYINGAPRPPVTSLARCYIANQGLIGSWELDDGETDPGTSTADDSSTLDNDAILVNWPEWAGGPHGRDDCDDDN